MSKTKIVQILLVVLAALAIASGCDEDENSRVAKVATEAAQRQAEQNQEMSRLNREVAQGTKRLVEGQANADQQWQSMEQSIQEQADHLEEERRQQAAARQRDSILAPVLWTLGVLLVCGLPLLVCWKLLTGLESETQSAELNQILIEELVFPAGVPALPDEGKALLHGAPSLDNSGARVAVPLPGQRD